MEFSIAQEVYVLLASFGSGILIGVLYDLLRTIRSYAKPSSSITAIQDTVFWCLATVFMFFTIFHTNNGVVRWYEFFGVFCGVIFYFFLLSRFAFFCLRKMSEFLLKIFLFFCKILLTPLRFTYNIIYKGLLFVFMPVYQFLRLIFRRVLFRLRAETKRTKQALLKK